MKRPLLAAVVILGLALLPAGAALSQEAGNSVYGGARRNTSGVSVGNLSGVDPKDGAPAYFVEANVLVNVKADEYLAVFALAQEGESVPEGNKRIDAQIEELRRSLRELGVKVKPESVFQEKYNTFFPSEMYSAYVAYQTGGVEAGRDMRVLEQRKTSTFYFNPLHTAEFDLVIDPAGAEPVVQCTLYLKVKCRLEP